MLCRSRFLLCALLAPLGGLAAVPPRTNVLFIMADDLRPDLATYGAPAVTPNLDRLARRAVQFDRAYCQQAVCNPSRSSMLTGLRPDTLRVWNNSTHFRDPNPGVTTLPQHFKQQGYDTRCVGKIFHNWHTQEKGDARSWSAPEFLHYATHGEDDARVAGPLPANHASPSPRAYTSVPLWECRDVPDEAYYDGRVAAEAVRVIAEIKDRPFFLAVGFWKPHAPFNAPKKYWDLYDRASLPPLNPDRAVGAPEIAHHDSREIRGIPPHQVDFTPAQIAEMRHGYLANISYFDAQLGKVLDALVELIDFFPTLSALCGLPAAPGLEGRNLAPVLANPAVIVKAAAFTQHPRPAYYDREPDKQPRAMGYSVRTPRARYTEWRDWKTGAILARELYEEADQPAETRNRIDEPRLESAQSEAEVLLRAQFPPQSH
ncbi:MAG: sulfatase [Opitutaceae bacterium]|nr:sulfatase [Opitutaceae bacterium]